MNMGAFTVVTLCVSPNQKGEMIKDYKGLASHQPVVAFSLALFLLSLAGVPPTGGFIAKFIIFAAAIDAHYYWLAAIGVLSSGIALFFYAKVIFYMYMQESENGMEVPSVGLAYKLVFLLSAVGTIVLGVYPSPFLEIGVNAVKPFIP
jgi:NADH-quinone oxidoreductase subunit N